MSLRVAAAGQAAKRGVIPRLPTGERLLADAAAWIGHDYADTVRSIQPGGAGEAAASLSVGLHPAADDLVLTATDAGRVTAVAETAFVGPGYHTFVCRLLARLGDELDVAWGETPPVVAATSAGPPLETTDPSTATRQTTEQVQLAWLRSILTEARDARARGATGIHFGTPPGVRYAVPAGIATALGPRDDAWLQAAVGDPRIAVEAWPWWPDATNARYLLNRALCLLWNEVRWRPPAIDEEVAVADEALGLLRRAYPLEPALRFPYRAWHDLLVLRGVRDPMARMVAERSAAVPPDEPEIGYRRGEVTVVHEGWALTVPGSFAERRTGGEWWGGDAGRRITLAAVETGRDGRPMTAEGFLAEVAGHLGSDVLTHLGAGGVLGRARLDTDTTSGMQGAVLDAYSAVIGRGAAIRIEFDDPDDWQWALDMWRSLHPV